MLSTVGIYKGNELTCNSSGNANAWPQSCRLAEPLWTGPGLKSGFSVHELISVHKNSADGN